jgi:raffinose/stachyose/melibiose transport system substrate-binding protein
MAPISSRKHRLAAVLTVPVLATALTLTACGGSSSGGTSSTGAEPQTITFAFGSANPGEHHFQDIAAAYEKAHPGVKITILKLPGESYSTAITTRIQGGNAPDVFQAESGSGQTDAVGNFAKAGLLLELTDPAFTAGLPKGENPAQFKFNDKVVAVPTATAVNGIVYNDELAKQNGVTITASTSLEDVIGQCATAKAKGKAIFGLAGAVPPNPAIATVELATSTVYGATPEWDQQRSDGKVKFATTPGWKTALESMKQLYDSGCFQPGAAGAGFDALTNGAGQGKIFGFFAPSGAAKNIMDAAGGHVKLVILPFPAPGGQTYLSVSSDIVVAGSAKTKSPKLTADFLKFFTSEEGKKIVADGQGSIPVNTTDTSKLLPQYAPVAKLITSDKVRGYPTANWPNGKIYDALGSGVTGILTGQKTPDQVLQDMDNAWG